jgi:hypothetical protein
MAVANNEIKRFLKSNFFLSLKLQFNETAVSFYQAFQVEAERRNEKRCQISLSGMVEGRTASDPKKVAVLKKKVSC